MVTRVMDRIFFVKKMMPRFFDHKLLPLITNLVELKWNCIMNNNPKKQFFMFCKFRYSLQQPPETLEASAVSFLVRYEDENIIWNMKSRKIHFEKYELVENSRVYILCREKLCFDYIIA